MSILNPNAQVRNGSKLVGIVIPSPPDTKIPNCADKSTYRTDILIFNECYPFFYVNNTDIQVGDTVSFIGQNSLQKRNPNYKGHNRYYIPIATHVVKLC